MNSLSQRPVTWSFDVFFDLCLNKRLSKQLWGWLFETPSYSLQHHCNCRKDSCHGTGIRIRTIHMKQSDDHLRFIMGNPYTNKTVCLSECRSINSLRPRLIRRPFTDDNFKCIFLNENEWILPRISLKFVPKIRINNIPALIQIMGWRRPGDKPLSEPMMVSLLTHICVTRPQCIKSAPRLMIGSGGYQFHVGSGPRPLQSSLGHCFLIVLLLLKYMRQLQLNVTQGRLEW